MNESPRRPGGSWKTTFSPFLPFSFLIPLFFPGMSEFAGFLTFFSEKKGLRSGAREERAQFCSVRMACLVQRRVMRLFFARFSPRVSSF
ncbi:hypothetical protein BOX30_09960 [Leptospirillum ferriphilum]|uniref:Uncharacterized protein n=3 Tax=Leptospirillum ferriphilum TaxID=178606 RepID=A0A059XX35_9BACT|nr:hypothetical protein LFML04_0451 [Leptospirillum ferriphilum ML-04]AIA31478.1 hypothetical protein Y981_02315 [Leptospirillum ferriphilum YSK]OOH72858.1 hypothetical protein BOX24_05590 [Leptospirillum ferriphilum]OOH77294.1 hypothetical protein BOX30_09960 [Leptospirillum ferriphilum]